MASSTIRMAIKNCLKNLTTGELEEFKDALNVEKGVPISSLEGQNFLGVTKVIDTTFADKALNVVVGLLNSIGCKKQANTLIEDTKELTSKAGSSQSAGASAGTDQVTPKADGEHFVDKYREKLTQKVTNIPQILDQLLTKKVIDQETYDKIRAVTTSQDQMRELYKSLNVAPACKDIFYKILEEKERWLLEDLKKNE